MIHNYITVSYHIDIPGYYDLLFQDNLVQLSITSMSQPNRSRNSCAPDDDAMARASWCSDAAEARAIRL